MIYQHALKYFVNVLFIHSLFQRFRGQFDRVIHRPNRLLDLLIPDLFLRIQTLICKTRASLLQEGKALYCHFPQPPSPAQA